MLDRFFCPGNLDGPEAVLGDSEAHHLLHVLRAQVGDRVELLNGQGDTAIAEVAETRKHEVRLTVFEHQHHPRLPGPILAVAVPKGDRFRWLIEKCVELGIERVIPLISERGSVIPRDAKLEKMGQTVIAACKQSRRNWLMEIDTPTPLAEVMRGTGGRRALVADPSGTATASLADAAQDPPVFFVGPEGGFTLAELELAAAQGAAVVPLGSEILRIETAAVALAAAWRLAHVFCE